MGVQLTNGVVKTQKRLDDFLKLGRYCGLLCIFAEVAMLVQAGTMFYMIYAGVPPKMDTVECNNDPSTRLLSTKEKCALINAQNCTNPTYDYQFYSVNVEFGLLCEAGKTVKKSISLQMFGVLLGSVVFGQMSDSFGRRMSLIIAFVGSIIGGVACAYANDLSTFTIARTVVGFFVGGHISVFCVFFVENLPKKDRLWLNMVITWSPNMPLFALLAYLTHGWRHLSLCLAGLNILPLIMIIFHIYESPRWLIQKGRISEARMVMMKIFQTDRTSTDDLDDLEDVLRYEHEFLQHQRAKGKDYYYYHLFSTVGLSMTTIILSFTYFSTSIINYGILFNMEKLSGSLYFNNVYTGLMRYAANLLFGYLDFKHKWMGRKLVHNLGLVTILIALGMVVFAHYFDLSESLSFAIRMAILVAASMTSQVYIAAGITGNELFPTPVRNLGFSMLQMWNRMGVVLSPFVFYLADYWIALPFVVMICTAFTDFSTWQFLLPETKGTAMIEHMPSRKQERLRRNLPKDERLVSDL